MLAEFPAILHEFNLQVWARLGHRPIRVLDAGCGSWAAIEPPADVDAKVTALDISQRQLDRQPDQVEKIRGDLQNYEFNPGSFDLIICLNVLEHLPRPEAAVDRMMCALKPKGLLVISGPTPLSIQAIATKFTPHSLHVAVYRYILGQKNAGRDDNAPFPLYLESFLDPLRLSDYLERHGFEIAYLRVYQGWHLRKIYTVVRPAYEMLRVASWCLSAATLFRKNFFHTDFQLVARKKTVC